MNVATRKFLEQEDEDLRDEVRSLHAPSPLRAAQMAGRSARILLAEDDPEMRSMLASSLRGDGYEVVEASSGDALLEEIAVLLFRGEALPADVIVSDQKMPGMPGLEILAGLRAARWPTPFILITAFGDRETHERAHQLGASAVFDKPFDLDELRGSIVDVLGGVDVAARASGALESGPEGRVARET